MWYLASLPLAFSLNKTLDPVPHPIPLYPAAPSRPPHAETSRNPPPFPHEPHLPPLPPPPCRTWSSGDLVELSLGLTYWIKGLPDTRPEYSGLKALMMGPFVMAGLTHDSRWLEVR